MLNSTRNKQRHSIPHIDFYFLVEVYEAMFSWDPISEVQYLDSIFRKYCSQGFKVVLDIGCGTGRTARGLMDLGYIVLGLDVCQKMCSYAHVSRKLDVIVGCGEFLPLKYRSVDAVYSLLATLNHFNSYERLSNHLREVYRVLKIGGVYVADAVVGSPGDIGVLEEWDTVFRGRKCKAKWIVESINDRYYTEVLELECNGSIFNSRATLYSPTERELLSLSQEVGFTKIFMFKPFFFEEKKGYGRTFILFKK